MRDDRILKNKIKTQTTLQAADTQRLSCVQREAVMTVLDVRLARHGIEVGLQGEF